MAVDSRDKRASATSSSFITLFPLPDGNVNATDRIVSAGEYALPNWVSADTAEDEYGPGYWSDVANANDGDTATYAEEQSAAALRDLRLTWNAPYPIAEKARVYLADSLGQNPTVDISIQEFPDGSWSQYVDEGPMTKDTWHEFYLGPPYTYRNVYRMRIVSTDATAKLRVHEAQVLNLRGIVQVGARPAVGGDLTKSAVIGSGLVN